MADKVSKEKRSQVMAQVKSVNTRPELLVRKFLFGNGYRYRVHDNKLPGKPDIKLPKFQTVIQVNGCFWHGHENCSGYQMPKTNKKFWNEKINRTKERDISNVKEIKRIGWKVFIIWECELRSKKREKTLNTLLKNLKKKEIL